MIRNFEDFCRELNICGFSMGGGKDHSEVHTVMKLHDWPYEVE